VSKNRYPGATWSPLPESGTHGRFVKTQLIFHSTGTRASAAANRRWFARGEVKAESHFIVDYDGGCLQIMEAYERADANTTASARALSVEVVGEAGEPFTPAQLARCQDIARWACQEHPVDRRQIPAHDASGIGWHVMFGAPGPWTSVRGKECPGSQRIAQVRDRIIPTVQKKEFTIMDQDTREYFDTQFARLSGGPRTRDGDGDVVDRDPQFISVADAYTLIETAEQRQRDALAAAEARLLAAIKDAS
jgi:hypothetical protein